VLLVLQGLSVLMALLAPRVLAQVVQPAPLVSLVYLEPLERKELLALPELLEPQVLPG
jgi:hypothetical protein